MVCGMYVTSEGVCMQVHTHYRYVRTYNRLPFQAVTILSSLWGLGLSCLCWNSIFLHSSNISAALLSSNSNRPATFSKDSLTIRIFWPFNSSCGSYMHGTESKLWTLLALLRTSMYVRTKMTNSTKSLLHANLMRVNIAILLDSIVSTE